MKIRLCYRLEKEIGMVEDEQGNPLECYVCCQVDVKKDPVRIGNIRYDGRVGYYRKRDILKKKSRK